MTELGKIKEEFGKYILEPDQDGEEEFRNMFPTDSSILRKAYIEGFYAGYKAGQPKWISVKDRLPEDDEIVLWLFESGGIIQDFLPKDMDCDVFLGGDIYTGPITHWQPLPPAPKVAESQD